MKQIFRLSCLMAAGCLVASSAPAQAAEVPQKAAQISMSLYVQENQAIRDQGGSKLLCDTCDAEGYTNLYTVGIENQDPSQLATLKLGEFEGQPDLSADAAAESMDLYDWSVQDSSEAVSNRHLSSAQAARAKAYAPAAQAADPSLFAPADLGTTNNMAAEISSPGTQELIRVANQ